MQPLSQRLCFLLVIALLSFARSSHGETNRLTTAINELGFDLLHTLAKAAPDENVLISPISLGLSLALIDQGAGNPAAVEIERTLHAKGMSRDEIRDGAKNLREKLTAKRPLPKEMIDYSSLEIAQSAWIDQSVRVQAPFLSIAQNDFHTDINLRDFSKVATAADMNAWVSEKTRGKITSVDAASSGAASIVLLNAVYFRDAWTSPFNTNKSHPQKFYGSARPSEPIFMERKLSSSYARSDGATCVNLYYQSSPFVMELVIPDNKSAFAKFDCKTMDKLQQSVTEREMNVKLPRFEFRQKMDLTDRLRLKRCLEPGAFRGIAEAAYLGSIIQQTCINVNESGTEAAAVTELSFVVMSMNEKKPPKPVTVTFDRPFLFAIRHDSTGAILFLGIVQNMPD